MHEHLINPEGFAKAKKEAETLKPNTTVSEIVIPPSVQNSTTLSSNIKKNTFVNPSSSIKYNGFTGLDVSRGELYFPMFRLRAESITCRNG